MDARAVAAPQIEAALSDLELGKDEFRAAARRLPSLERYVVWRHFGLDGLPPATLSDLARDLGVTAKAVRRFEAAGLAHIAEWTKVADKSDDPGHRLRTVARGLADQRRPLVYRRRAIRRGHTGRHRRAPGRKPIRRPGSRRTPSPTRGDPDDGDPEPPAPAPGARRQHRGGTSDQVAAQAARSERRAAQ